MIQSRLAIKQAKEAVVTCNATPEAYEVLKAAGYHELFPGCIYRDEVYMAIAVSTAREILTQAKADDTFDGPIPEDDAAAIKAAEELVEMAEQAWASNIRGPEVEKILKLAAADQNGEQPQSETPPEPKADESGDDDEVSTPSVFEDLPDNLTKAEPYEGYAEDRVKDITDAINWYLDESDQSQDENLELLKHCWAFESSHKNRSRILKFISEAYVRAGGEIGGTQEAETESSNGSEEPGPTPEAEASSEDADAIDDAESEVGSESSEGAASDGKTEKADEPRGSKGSDAYQKLIDLVDGELKKERLDIPEPPSEDAPELPWRWSEISDEQLQNFHMQFAAMAYYKSYQQTRDERIAIHCRSAADEMHGTILVHAEKYDEKGKPKTMTLIEAEVESDDRVKRWRKLQRRHESFALNHKQEMGSYYKLVEALSRLESMRHNAWERGRR